MTTFAEYSEVEPSDLAAESRPPDVAVDMLPFEYLPWRHFELLTYELERWRGLPDGHRLSLMNDGADQGCDIVEFDDIGCVFRIVQCKRLTRPLTLPAVSNELMKIILHCLLQPGALAEHFEWQLWAPRLNRASIEFFAKWPASWDEGLASRAFKTTKRKYSAFDALHWSAAKEFITSDVPHRLTISVVDGVEITRRVRAVPSIYSRFFQTAQVLSLNDAKVLLKESMEQRLTETLELIKEGGFRPVSDADVAELLDLLNSMSQERRHFVGPGYLLGIPPRLLHVMTNDRRNAFLRRMMEHIAAPMHSLYRELSIVIKSIEPDLRRTLPGCSASYLYVVVEAVRRAALMKLKALGVPKALHASLGVVPVDKQLSRREFREYCGIVFRELTGADENLIKSAPDVYQAMALARPYIVGDKTLDSFVEGLCEEHERFADVVAEFYRNRLDLIPERFVLISDMASDFLRNRETVQRWQNSTMALAPSAEPTGGA